MTKNLYEFSKFKTRRNDIISLNENVQLVDDVYRVRKRIDVPSSLVNAFKKKVKDESGKNISQFYSDVELAEEIAQYIIDSYISIENLPVNLILGDQYSKGGAQTGGAQSQSDFEDTEFIPGQGQGQPPVQGQGQPVQGQMPVQGQGQAPTQGQAPVQGAQKTAAQIPPTQGGQVI